MELHGCFYILAIMPIWTIILCLFVFSGLIIWVCREFFEGFVYDVSHASRYGVFGLFLIILIGATILHRHPDMSGWIGSEGLHDTFFAISAIVFMAMTYAEASMRLKSVKRQIADTYHNIVIIPVLTYLLGTTLLLILFKGTITEILSSLLFFSLSGLLSIYDFKKGRLNQRAWIEEHGFESILKKG